MKKTMKTLLALMAGVMTFSACSNEDVQTNETSTRTFTAFTEGNGTRATIDGFSVKWQDFDAILVLAGEKKARYALSDGANTTSGTFTGNDVSGGDIYALSPYLTYEWGADLFGIFTNIPVTLDGSTIKGVTLPSIQKIAAGQVVDPKAMLMAGKADEVDNLNFKNVCSYIKVTTVSPCEQIWVQNLSYEATLAGKIDVDMSSGVPTVTSIYNEDKHSEVTLEASEGMLAPGTYYIAVLPGTASSGLVVRFYTDNSTYTENKTTNSFTFERNKVYNGGSQPTENPHTDAGYAEATGIGNVNWVQLWENGPKFAEYNVGVTDGRVENYGGYYTWGGSIDKDPQGAFNDGSNSLTGNDDTATNLWGSNWRMPTRAELQALIDNCDTSWAVVNGVGGNKYTGRGNYASNSVFLPATGFCRFGTLWGQDNTSGYYWSSTLDEHGVPQRLSFFYMNGQRTYDDDRTYSLSVRAVLAEQQYSDPQSNE